MEEGSTYEKAAGHEEHTNRQFFRINTGEAFEWILANGRGTPVTLYPFDRITALAAIKRIKRIKRKLLFFPSIRAASVAPRQSVE